MATYKLFNQAHPNGTTDQTSTVIRTDVTPNKFIPMIDPGPKQSNLANIVCPSVISISKSTHFPQIPIPNQ